VPVCRRVVLFTQPLSHMYRIGWGGVAETCVRESRSRVANTATITVVSNRLGRVWPTGARVSRGRVRHRTTIHVQNRLERARANNVRMSQGRSKLPRPTRSRPPCGGRSLLEGGALPKRHRAPRPRAWARPGFLLPSTAWPTGRSGAATRLPEPCRGSSRRFTSRCSRALPQPGDGNRTRSRSSSPSTGPETGRSRTTDASLLVASTDPGMCEDGSARRYGRQGIHCVRTRFLPSLPLASLAAEEGGSALPLADHVNHTPPTHTRRDSTGHSRHPTRSVDDTLTHRPHCPARLRGTPLSRPPPGTARRPTASRHRRHRTARRTAATTH